MWETIKDISDTALSGYERFVDATTKAEATKIKAQTEQASSASQAQISEYLSKARAYQWYIVAGVVLLVCVIFGVKFLKKRA